MLNQLSNMELWLIVIISFLIPLAASSIILLLYLKKKMNKLEDYLSMNLIKGDRIIENDEKTIEALEYLLNEVDSLSSSNEMILSLLQPSQGQTRHNRHSIYPTPDLSRAIDQTIKDQITNEFTLSYKLKAPRSNYLQTIVTNVSRTYPQISIEYITKRTVAMVETSFR